MRKKKKNLGQWVDGLIMSEKDRITRKLGGFSFLYAYHKVKLVKKQRVSEC